MSRPRRSLGPVIAYMLTLLGLVLGGIWLWEAMHRTPLPRVDHEAQVAPAARNEPAAAVARPQTVPTPPNGEELSASERQQLDNLLRRKSAAAKP